MDLKKKSSFQAYQNYIYSGPLNNTSLNMQAHFYVNFFNKYAVSHASPFM